MIWCDNQWLIPSGFAYRDDLTQEEEEQAWSAIQNAKRLEVMWDDNDEYATAKVSEDTFKVDRDEVRIYLKANKELPREVVGLWKRSRLPVQIYLQRDKELPCEVVTVLKCSQLSHVAFATYLDITDTVAPFAMDLSGLKGTTITKLDLCGIIPTEWQSCEGIQDMRVMNWYGLRVAFGISCLHNLRNLQLGGVESLPADFGDLNLTCFDLVRSNNLELSDLVPHLGKMPNLETLRYIGNKKENTLIPTELGNLVSLKIVDLQRNRFVGTIPSELGRLRNLTSLTIREYAGLDLTCPQEVLNLNLAELVVGREHDLVN
jgi:hypothetical protein